MEPSYMSTSDVSPPTPTPTLSFNLAHCRYEVWASLPPSLPYFPPFVATIFPDGKSCIGTRDDNYQNRREAESQGYTGPDAVWRSLVEHELLHSLVSEIMFDRPSLVMETESGRHFHPSWLRYEEETIVLALQHYIQTGHRPNILNRYTGEGVEKLETKWWREFVPSLGRVYKNIRDISS